MGLGTPEILIVAVVVMVLFGAGSLPKFAKSLGKAKNEFEKALNSSEEKEEQKKTDPEKKTENTENKDSEEK